MTSAYEDLMVALEGLSRRQEDLTYRELESWGMAVQKMAAEINNDAVRLTGRLAHQEPGFSPSDLGDDYVNPFDRLRGMDFKAKGDGTLAFPDLLFRTDDGSAYPLLPKMGADPVMADILAIKRGQADGIVDPKKETPEDAE